MVSAQPFLTTFAGAADTHDTLACMRRRRVAKLSLDYTEYAALLRKREEFCYAVSLILWVGFTYKTCGFMVCVHSTFGMLQQWRVLQGGLA